MCAVWCGRAEEAKRTVPYMASLPSNHFYIAGLLSNRFWVYPDLPSYPSTQKKPAFRPFGPTSETGMSVPTPSRTHRRTDNTLTPFAEHRVGTPKTVRLVRRRGGEFQLPNYLLTIPKSTSSLATIRCSPHSQCPGGGGPWLQQLQKQECTHSLSLHWLHLAVEQW